MGSVHTVKERESTSLIVREDGMTVIKISVEGDLPERLVALCKLAATGREEAVEYVEEFLSYWGSQKSSEWAKQNCTLQ